MANEKGETADTCATKGIYLVPDKELTCTSLNPFWPTFVTKNRKLALHDHPPITCPRKEDSEYHPPHRERV